MTDIPYSQIQAVPVQQQVNQSLNYAATRANQLGIELGPELRAELAAPTTYYPGEEQNANPGFYENTTWANIQPQQRQAKPVDTRPQPEIAYENYLAEKHQAEQPQEQAKQVQGQNAKLVAASLEYGWETPSFQAYLDSDDDAYLSMRLSPQQIQLANEVWGLDEDTAKAYIYHHKLTAEDLALIETSFTGKTSSLSVAAPPPPRLEPKSKTVDDDDGSDDDDSSYAPDSNTAGNTAGVGDYDSVAALDDVNHMRRTYFSQANDAEWSAILNDCIDEFESLPQQEREAYDNPAGIWALHQRVSYRRQQQAQAQQKRQQGALKKQTQSFNNTALTRDGRLRQSWIDRLSPQQYEQQADRIYQWYRAGKVDRNAYY
ncbi:hypothetical protein [Scytonema millei]|uniref:Uncharacterized protein n=1 Tax=Scytonema millei VB511283 TaxID=1245923 RepID=A0A9X5I3P8_9CYAN|nr:hypothetical protein [Scytonema millei]NHC33794.1 hypothetical protein [Scytonema millei VB511283]